MEGKDKLSELLDSLLSDEEAMGQLRDAAAGLGLDGLLEDSLPSDDTRHESHDKLRDDSHKPSGRQPQGSPLPDDLLSAVGKIVPLMSELSREDECTRLLEALRPFLSQQRRERIDSARTLLNVMRIARLLRDTDSSQEGTGT